VATSYEIPGLVAQGRSVTETLEIAQSVAKKLQEAQAELKLQQITIKNTQTIEDPGRRHIKSDS
jgi:predicted RNase H-like HicB family nuclease